MAEKVAGKRLIFGQVQVLIRRHALRQNICHIQNVEVRTAPAVLLVADQEVVVFVVT